MEPVRNAELLLCPRTVESESVFNNRRSGKRQFLEGRTSSLKAEGQVACFQVTYGPGDIFQAERTANTKKGLEAGEHMLGEPKVLGFR